MMDHGAIVSRGRTMITMTRIFIIKAKLKQWIWLVSPFSPPSPSLYLSLSPSCPSFLPFFSDYLNSHMNQERRKNELNEHIFIGQVICDRHSKSMKTAVGP